MGDFVWITIALGTRFGFSHPQSVVMKNIALGGCADPARNFGCAYALPNMTIAIPHLAQAYDDPMASSSE